MEMDPNLIANLDETNITQDIHGGLIISKRGKRDVKKVRNNGSGKSRCTSVNVISAGDYIYDSFLLLEGQEVDKKQILRHPDGREDLKCLKEGTGWAMTPCGYMMRHGMRR